MSRRRLPRVIPHMARDAMLGFAVAAVFVGGLFAFDIGGLAAWLQGATWSMRLGTAALLWSMTGLIFASAQMAFAQMALSGSENETDGWRFRPRAGALIPIRVDRRRPRR